MEKMKVRDLMVPADRFPRLSAGATFYEAIEALEAAQKNYQAGAAEQRILLVEDTQGKIIGKLSPIDLLRGLEARYRKEDIEKSISRLGLDYVWNSMQKDLNLWDDPFRNLCRKAGNIHIGDFIKNPSEGPFVHPDDTLAKCFHLFVVNRHDALFVFEGQEIVGMLRFSDVYRKAVQVMKACIL